MTTRTELIEAGTQAVCAWDPDYDPTDEDTRAAVGVVIDAVEGKIRADEREFLAPEVPFARDDLRNELRAKIKALPALVPDHRTGRAWVERADVLDLLDGDSDE